MRCRGPTIATYLQHAEENLVLLSAQLESAAAEAGATGLARRRRQRSFSPCKGESASNTKGGGGACSSSDNCTRSSDFISDGGSRSFSAGRKRVSSFVLGGMCAEAEDEPSNRSDGQGLLVKQHLRVGENDPMSGSIFKGGRGAKANDDPEGEMRDQMNVQARTLFSFERRLKGLECRFRELQASRGIACDNRAAPSSDVHLTQLDQRICGIENKVNNIGKHSAAATEFETMKRSIESSGRSIRVFDQGMKELEQRVRDAETVARAANDQLAKAGVAGSNIGSCVIDQKICDLESRVCSFENAVSSVQGDFVKNIVERKLATVELQSVKSIEEKIALFTSQVCGVEERLHAVEDKCPGSPNRIPATYTGELETLAERVKGLLQADELRHTETKTLYETVQRLADRDISRGDQVRALESRLVKACSGGVDREFVNEVQERFTEVNRHINELRTESLRSGQAEIQVLGARVAAIESDHRHAKASDSTRDSTNNIRLPIDPPSRDEFKQMESNVCKLLQSKQDHHFQSQTLRQDLDQLERRVRQLFEKESHCESKGDTTTIQMADQIQGLVAQTMGKLASDVGDVQCRLRLLEVACPDALDGRVRTLEDRLWQLWHGDAGKDLKPLETRILGVEGSLASFQTYVANEIAEMLQRIKVTVEAQHDVSTVSAHVKREEFHHLEGLVLKQAQQLEKIIVQTKLLDPELLEFLQLELPRIRELTGRSPPPLDHEMSNSTQQFILPCEATEHSGAVVAVQDPAALKAHSRPADVLKANSVATKTVPSIPVPVECVSVGSPSPRYEVDEMRGDSIRVQSYDEPVASSPEKDLRLITRRPDNRSLEQFDASNIEVYNVTREHKPPTEAVSGDRIVVDALEEDSCNTSQSRTHRRQEEEDISEDPLTEMLSPASSMRQVFGAGGARTPVRVSHTHADVADVSGISEDDPKECASGSGVPSPAGPGLSTYSVKVIIKSARGLRDTDPSGFWKPDPYCVLELPSRPEWKSRTNVVHNKLDPIWDYECDVDHVQLSESLRFSIYDQDQWPQQGVILGRVSLSATAFLPTGFEGELACVAANGESEAFLTVHVCNVVEKPQMIDNSLQASLPSHECFPKLSVDNASTNVADIIDMTPAGTSSKEEAFPKLSVDSASMDLADVVDMTAAVASSRQEPFTKLSVDSASRNLADGVGMTPAGTFSGQEPFPKLVAESASTNLADVVDMTAAGTSSKEEPLPKLSGDGASMNLVDVADMTAHSTSPRQEPFPKLSGGRASMNFADVVNMAVDGTSSRHGLQGQQNMEIVENEDKEVDEDQTEQLDLQDKNEEDGLEVLPMQSESSSSADSSSSSQEDEVHSRTKVLTSAVPDTGSKDDGTNPPEDTPPTMDLWDDLLGGLANDIAGHGDATGEPCASSRQSIPVDVQKSAPALASSSGIGPSHEAKQNHGVVRSFDSSASSSDASV